MIIIKMIHYFLTNVKGIGKTLDEKST